MEAHGGACGRCGYATNLAALDFHHVYPERKTFNLDLRALSNRTWKAIEQEARHGIVLCKNGHAEEHYPHLSQHLPTDSSPLPD